MGISRLLVAGVPACAQNPSMRRRATGSGVRPLGQQRLQPRERAHLRRHLHRRARCPIQHPRRQLEPAVRASLGKTTSNDPAPHPLHRFMDGNDAPKPWMPAIADLVFVGPVGVPSSRCTTRCTRTAPSGGAHLASSSGRTNLPPVRSDRGNSRDQAGPGAATQRRSGGFCCCAPTSRWNRQSPHGRNIRRMTTQQRR
jgi:hypothetical protein